MHTACVKQDGDHCGDKHGEEMMTSWVCVCVTKGFNHGHCRINDTDGADGRERYEYYDSDSECMCLCVS